MSKVLHYIPNPIVFVNVFFYFLHKLDAEPSAGWHFTFYRYSEPSAELDLVSFRNIVYFCNIEIPEYLLNYLSGFEPS